MIQALPNRVHPGQGLQILKVNQNPGILPVKLGRAFVQQDSWSIIKILSLKGIITDFTFNVRKYEDFNRLVQLDKPNIQNFIGLKQQVEYLRDEVKDKLRQLIPTKRVKRGIINPLGSIIKVITGNLDYEDAIRYDQLITEIKTQEQAIDNKITIITEVLDHFMNSTKVIDSNTKILDERLKLVENTVKKISSTFNNTIYSTQVLTLYNMFIINFRTLYTKINEIETALAFSKVSVLYKAMFNSTELLNSLKAIARHYNLMYEVNEQNLINIEESLSVKTYTKYDQITFIVDVPIISNISYNYYKLYPLPIADEPRNLTFVIVPKLPYLLVEGTKYIPTAEKCKEITAEEYLCSESEEAPYIKVTCIEQLMRYNNDLSHCHPRSVDLEDLKFQKISPDSWVLYVKHEVILSQRCGNDVVKKQLKGTYIVTVEEPCEITIGNTQIYGRRSYVIQSENRPLPLISLPEIQQQRAPEDEVPVNLQGINLDDVQHLNYMIQKSVNSGVSETQFKSVSVATIALYVIAIICVILLITYKYMSIIKNKCNRTRDDDTENVPASPDERNVNPPLLLSTYNP